MTGEYLKFKLHESFFWSKTRGGDKGAIFDKYLNRDKPQRFVIRLVERDLIHKGQKKNCLEMAKALPTPYETVLIVYDDGKEKKKTVQYNALPVKASRARQRSLSCCR